MANADRIEQVLNKIEQKIGALGDDAPIGDAQEGKPAVPGIASGESALTSRGFSIARLTRALVLRSAGDPSWRDYAKVELDLAGRLRDAWQQMNGTCTGVLVPLATDLMPVEEQEIEGGAKLPGFPRELVKEARELMRAGVAGADPEFDTQWLRQKGFRVKTLQAGTAGAGAELVALAAQGELIEALRAVEVFARAGAMEVDLPPAGQIRYPKSVSSDGLVFGDVAFYGEGATATVSTGTGATSAVTLAAKKVVGMVDVTEELIKFATSVSVETWLRSELAADLATRADREMIAGSGTGGTIKGIITYSGIANVVALNTGADGDTAHPEDAARLFGAIQSNNAPVERGFFYALTATLYAGILTRTDAQGAFKYVQAFVRAPGEGPSLLGFPAVLSQNVPRNRSKGTASNLTLLLGGVGPEWVIGRAGVLDFAVTQSDGTKFQQGISTVRAVEWIDGVPRHPESFGIVDTLVNG